MNTIGSSINSYMDSMKNQSDQNLSGSDKLNKCAGQAGKDC